MKMLRNIGFLILIFTFFSCTRQFHIARVVPGKTTVHEAVKYLGTPINNELNRSSFNSNEDIMVWDDVQVQVQDQFVTAVHRSPASHERSLQFWRQHYKQENQTLTKVSSKFYNGEHIWQLDIPNRGINLVYDETRDEVVKVVYYEVD